MEKLFRDSTFWLFSSGGVVLASRDGKIVCENTLDARLDVVFRKKLPEVFFFLCFFYCPCFSPCCLCICVFKIIANFFILCSF